MGVEFDVRERFFQKPKRSNRLFRWMERPREIRNVTPFQARRKRSSYSSKVKFIAS